MKLTPAQRQAVEHRGSNLLVAASAGSGKTEVLAQRCVDLIADPHKRCGIDRLLVVTFTRAAAAELRVRVADMLRRRAQGLPQTDMRDHLRQQALLVDAADIGTIDAWCGRIVREHFAPAGIDPAFAVLSEQEAWLLRDEVLEGLFEWIYAADDGPAAAARDWIERHNRPSDEFLRSLILELNAYREHLVDPDQWFAQQLNAYNRTEPELRVDAERLLAESLAAECRFQHDQMAELVAGAAGPLSGKLGCYRAALADWCERLADPQRLTGVLDEVSRFRFARLAGNSAAGDAELLKEVQERWLKRRLKVRWDSGVIETVVANAGTTAALIVTLLRLEARFREMLAAAKQQRAVYEFADVLRMALNLLGTPTEAGPRERTPIARALQQRYEHILVDEFQDTSPVQVEILRLVARDEPGKSNRFMVGDIKQSIYGFRQAEPRLFVELIRALETDSEEGQVRPLSDNFRSHSDLLEGLNRLFAMLFDPQLGGTPYGKAEELQAQRDDIPNPAWDNQPRIELYLLEAPRGRRAATADDSEADQVPLEQIERETLVAAQAVRRLLDAGAQIPERGEDGRIRLRPLRLADIVILLRSAKQNAAIVAATLRKAGIPALAAGRESILESVEVGDVRNALTLLVNRRQDVPLAAYLRGPMGGLSAAELLEVRQASAGGDFHDAVERYRQAGANPTLTAKLNTAIEQLDRWLIAAREKELPALIRQILRETGLLFFAQALPGGEHRVATLRALENLAAELTADGRAGLAEFVEHLEALSDQELSAAAPLAAGEQVVQVMTIHAAKGLEFPVVFLLNSGAEFSRQRRTGRSVCHQDCGIGLRFADRLSRSELASAAHSVIATQTAKRELEEELRLLYVAATRARERLFILGHTEPGTWETLRSRYAARGSPPPLIARLNARSMLEWVMLSTAASGSDQADRAGKRLVQVATHDSNAISAAQAERPAEQPPTLTWQPADEQWMQEARSLLSAEVNTTSAALPAVLSVSALKELADRRWTEDTPRVVAVEAPPLRTPAFALAEPRIDGRTVGVACHRFLQHADLARLGSAEAVREQVAAMVSAGRLPTAEADLVPVADLVWFGTTSEAALLAKHTDSCRREIPFVYALPVEDIGERIIVRGIIDCLVELPDGLLIFDYKTDRIPDAAAWQGRVAGYTVQLQLYAAAAADIFARPVKRALLVFLHGRKVLDVPLEIPALRAMLGG
jgi:ATP-dependent helicase/nuclease subunit A